MKEQEISPAVMLVACADLIRDLATTKEVTHRKVEQAKTWLRKEALKHDGNVIHVIAGAMLRLGQMYEEEVLTPARDFDAEFDYQVKNGLCGGPLCINPDCFCDEGEGEPVAN